jgi:hypothetical protein
MTWAVAGGVGTGASPGENERQRGEERVRIRERGFGMGEVIQSGWTVGRPARPKGPRPK